MGNFKDKIPEVDLLKDRFSFIKNEVLRENLAIAFQYIIYSVAVEEETELPGPVSYSIYKNIIVYTASIVEGILHHCLSEQIANGKIPDTIMPKEDKYSNKKIIYKIPDSGKEVVGAIFERKHSKLKEDTPFRLIIRAAKKADIINDELYVEIEELRMKRNRIHLAGLTQVDDFYDKATVNKSFTTAKKLINVVEELLKKST